MSQPKHERKRGVILTPQGQNKLQKAKSEAELQKNSGRYTLEDLNELTGLSVDTLIRVHNCSVAVDKQSLMRYFKAFKLELELSDYYSPKPHMEEIEKSQAEDTKLELPGGQVPLDSVFYIERPPIESRCYEAILQPGALACGVIDITSIGSQQLTLEQWYASLIRSLVTSFELEVNLRDWWRDREYISCIKRLSEFVEDVLLMQISQDMVIFIDEIDSVLGLNFDIDDFFAWIRANYNKRAERQIYRRLTFALLGVATPSDLIADKNRTPFNIGQAIDLNGFKLDEAQPLIPGLRGKVRDPEKVLKQLLEWTGGHKLRL